VRDYVDLTRPRIGAMVLVTVTVGAVLGTWGLPSPMLLLHALAGTALVAASAGALNQWLERDSDRRMPRTAQRPLPAGRMHAVEAVGFGLLSAALGLTWLAVAVNVRTALLGLATWVLYVWVYTPLKSRTPANTAVGAVAGALPVLMGWAAVGGRFDLSAATLFLIVYLWQFPHFMAIAWMYRDQYAAAGLKMLSVVDPSGRRAGRQAVTGAAALLAVSLLPAWNLVGPDRALVYLLGAALLGLAQLALSVSFGRRLDETSARRLLRASLVYLPGLLSLLMLARLI
jgi:protoheme IX farnesyltransferase